MLSFLLQQKRNRIKNKPMNLMFSALNTLHSGSKTRQKGFPKSCITSEVAKISRSGCISPPQWEVLVGHIFSWWAQKTHFELKIKTFQTTHRPDMSCSHLPGCTLYQCQTNCSHVVLETKISNIQKEKPVINDINGEGGACQVAVATVQMQLRLKEKNSIELSGRWQSFFYHAVSL